MAPRRPQKERRVIGVIRADEAYSRDEFLARIRRSAATGETISTLEKKGLVVCRDGGRTYILGEDWIAYLRTRRRT